MTKHTKRDKVWHAALKLRESGKFVIEDVLNAADLNESSERTARDVLLTMEDLDHLEAATYKNKKKPRGEGAYRKRLWHQPGHIPMQWAIDDPDRTEARVFENRQENRDLSEMYEDSEQ